MDEQIYHFLREGNEAADYVAGQGVHVGAVEFRSDSMREKLRVLIIYDDLVGGSFHLKSQM